LYLDKTTEELLASDAGQIDYAASGSIYNTPLASKKSKATIKLNNNTTAAA